MANDEIALGSQIMERMAREVLERAMRGEGPPPDTQRDQYIAVLEALYFLLHPEHNKDCTTKHMAEVSVAMLYVSAGVVHDMTLSIPHKCLQCESYHHAEGGDINFCSDNCADKFREELI